MKKILIFCCITIVLFCSLAFSQDTDTVKLEYNFKLGDTLSYQMKIDGEMKVQVKQEQGPVLPESIAKMQGSFEYIQNIKEIDEKNEKVKIDITYGKSVMNTIVDGNTIANPDVAALDGKVAVLSVKENGEVLDYQLPEGLPAAFQNADFRKMFVVFPTQQLRIGESWVKDVSSSDDENKDFSTKDISHSKYTFVGMEKKGAYNCAKVKLESDTDSFTKSKKTEFDFQGKVNGKVEGFIYYDLASGYMVYSDLYTKINNEIVNKGELPSSEKKEDGKKTVTITTDLLTVLHTVTELL